MAAQQWEKRVLGRTAIEGPVLGIGGAWLGHEGGGKYDPDLGVEPTLAALDSRMAVAPPTKLAPELKPGLPEELHGLLDWELPLRDPQIETAASSAAKL